MRPWPIFTLATRCTTKGKGLPTQQVLTLHLRDHFTSISRRTSGVHHYLSIHDFFHIYLSRYYLQECLSPTLCGVHLWTLCIIRACLIDCKRFFMILWRFVQTIQKHWCFIVHYVTLCLVWLSGGVVLCRAVGVSVWWCALWRSVRRFKTL